MAPPPPLETILIERLSTGTVLLSYNTPKRSNAFTPQQYDDLREGLVWAREEAEVRVVVVTGRGRHYCADRAMGGPSDTIEAEVRAGAALSAVLMPFPKVLIAAVHGASIGWGCTQLSNFDLVYAHQDAFFQTPFMQLGLVPEGGSSYMFPRVMGRVQANRLLLAGERMSAQQAYLSGLITEVVEADSPDAFLAKAVEKAKIIGGYSAEALLMAKKLIMDATDDFKARKAAGERERRDILIRFSRDETKASLAAAGNKSKAKM
ncbi:ClpP/crotonase [Amniculicola lignicola CBS 123094]|uniref:ClpP/crotonase n=1 Tax=Amniculicola lignicola CBS 123094 TaxID=1392246 RepID=A0A6A5X384_9PLEO|nr:ClpP/crotonase [Amniculicola lignicola CBS 123094]